VTTIEACEGRERTSREERLIFVMDNAFKRCGVTAAVYTTCRAHGTIHLLARFVTLTTSSVTNRGVIYDLRGQLAHCLAAQPAVLGELERCRDS
jgi:hypothetical protein